MKNRLLVIITLFGFYVLGYAQTVIPKDASLELRQKIVEKTKTTTSISSDFVQVKHIDFLSNDIKSHGNLYYKAPDVIKLVYTNPFNYSALFKDNKLYVNDGGKKNVIDLSTNSTFKSINNLVVSCVNGDMFDDEKFNISYFETHNYYQIHFNPKSTSLKTYINEFILNFNKETLEITSIKMLEESGDYTLLKIIHQKLNEAIPDTIFIN